MNDDIRHSRFDVNSWTIVGNRRKRSMSNHNIKELSNSGEQNSPQLLSPCTKDSEKISEPCWFFNNGGCRNKDGSEKIAEDCKYLHIYSENVKRPPHLSTKKPCDKFNLENDCIWGDNCKYSHRSLSPDEWDKFYPDIPFALKTNITFQKKLLETKVNDIEEHIKVVEFKQDGMTKDIQYIGQGVHKCLRNIQALMEFLLTPEQLSKVRWNNS